MWYNREKIILSDVPSDGRVHSAGERVQSEQQQHGSGMINVLTDSDPFLSERLVHESLTALINCRSRVQQHFECSRWRLSETLLSPRETSLLITTSLQFISPFSGGSQTWQAWGSASLIIYSTSAHHAKSRETFGLEGKRQTSCLLTSGIFHYCSIFIANWNGRIGPFQKRELFRNFFNQILIRPGVGDRKMIIISVEDVGLSVLLEGDARAVSSVKHRSGTLIIQKEFQRSRRSPSKEWIQRSCGERW